MREVAVPASRVVAWSTWILSLIGVGISTYLTIAHYVGSSILACSDSGTINCAVVTTSAQSHFLGLPVADLGLAFYLAMAVINFPTIWSRSERWISALRAAMIASGMLMVLWLVAAELLIIDHICLWCTGVHIVTFVLFVILVRVLPQQLTRAD